MGRAAHFPAAIGPCFRVVLACLAALTALAAPAVGAAPRSADPALAQRLAHALTVPHVAAARTGAAAIDLESGAAVYTQNGGLPLAPASNEKLPLTLAALLDLGPGFRIDTDVLGIGEQVGPVWDGRLVLRGYGDPQLTSGGLARLAAAVRAAGIERVTGGIVADESFFDSLRVVSGWKRSFYMDESPPLSALVVDRAVYAHHMTGAPALAAGLLFRAALRQAGVAVPGAVTVGQPAELATPLATIQSPPLWRILRFMDRESDNFTAELLLKQLGAFAGDQGTSAGGAAEVLAVLQREQIPTAGVTIVDGSGLSVLDRLTPDCILGVLRAAWTTPALRAAFTSVLPVAGRNGTLQHRMRTGPARGRVLAKTGTTNLASALSGFAAGRYAFAVLQNGHPISAWWARTAQDRFATALVRAASH
jgi:D-alanyl-D-alanine carboxypeptidase/D-alanyl-D-alanine-endopeptidase (penicillin-binding protein 4)